MLTRVIGVGIENTMERATSKAVADAAIGAQQSQADREREAKLMEITYKNTPLAVREAFLKGVDEMMNTAMAEGSWKGLAAALVKRIPSMFASITTGLTPALEAIGNIEYAVSNAQSFEQLIEDIKTASQEFASSVQTANDGLARNENSYYDYINSIQDAERTRYEALMAAEKTYQDALMRTGQVFKDNFLGPAVENIGAGFSNALAGLQELEVFTAPLGALNTKNNLGTLFDGLTGGAQVGGSDMLDAGLGLVGAGGLSLATTTISAIGTVFGMVFNSALTGQSEYLIDFIKKFASELPNTIKTVMKEVGPLFKEIFLILVDDVLPNVLTALVEVLPGLLSEVIVTVVQKFPEIISMMLGALFQLIRPLIGVVFEMAGALLPNLANLIAELTAVIPTLAVLMIVGLVENLPMLIARLIPAIIGAVIGIVPDLILRTIGGISKGLTGTDITKGFSVTKTITNALGGALGLDKFHEGGLVPGRGERPAMLLGGEAVLTREAVAMLGGVKAINNINGGQFIPDYQRVATSSTPMSAPSRVSAAPQTYNTNNQKTQTFHLTVNAASGTSRDETLRNSRLMVAELRKKMKQADKNRE
jgi:phage-related protein